MLFTTTSKTKAFTLIEVLLAIILTGILACVIYVAFNTSFNYLMMRT
ncbi:MAG: prepilin-type N-terminal cleavage/methylation domain-containing protein [Candidatus Omnitrophica bacterium]|nr:prepilin-type N-terminal cleavage/methylation domain-containing protein [Candidatus Omnitrophota bacterium]